DIKSLQQLLQLKDFMINIDLESFFHLIQVDQEFRSFFGFNFNNRFYLYRAMHLNAQICVDTNDVDGNFWLENRLKSRSDINDAEQIEENEIDEGKMEKDRCQPKYGEILKEIFWMMEVITSNNPIQAAIVQSQASLATDENQTHWGATLKLSNAGQERQTIHELHSTSIDDQPQQLQQNWWEEFWKQQRLQPATLCVPHSRTDKQDPGFIVQICNLQRLFISPRSLLESPTSSKDTFINRYVRKWTEQEAQMICQLQGGQLGSGTRMPFTSLDG
ncbi:MAG: hypothetical protein EZS28_029046, partial [Streblomastix strix]